MQFATGIRAKLLALVALPMALMALMAAVLVSSAARTASQAGHVRETTDFVRLIDSVTSALQNERYLTYRAGEDESAVELAKQLRLVTDAALAELHAAVGGASRWPAAAEPLAQMTAAHDALRTQRENYDSRAVGREVLEDYYTRLIRADLVVSRLVVAGSGSEDISQSLRAYDAVADFVEAASLERDLAGKAFRLDLVSPTAYRQIAGLAGEQDSYLDAFASVATTEQRDRLAASLENVDVNAVANLRQRLDTVLNQTRPGDPDAWESAATARITPVVDVRRSVLDDVRRIASTSARRAQREVAVISGLSLLAAAVVLLLVVLLSRTITKPLISTALVLEEVAAGDLTSRLRVRSRDELGRMAAALNATLDRLAGVFESMTANSVMLAGASEELSAVSLQLSQSANRTASEATAASSAAEEVSASVGVVALSTEDMSASIRDVSVQAASAVDIARAGGETARLATDTVERLGEASTQIGAIVEVITSIAHQTHLLALNATIEAARAGDAGAGFAIVAHEVKELSQKTAEATNDITQRVRGLQESASAGNEAIRSIVGVIESISENQLAISSAVEEQTATTGSIGVSLAEAARGTVEIAKSVTSVADAAEQTTRGAAETQVAAEELSRMAAELQLLLSHYTTKAAEPVSTPSAT